MSRGRQPPKVATCIGCGCDDDHACIDGFDEACSWVRVDRDAGLGVCSCCVVDASRWDAGDRELHRSDGPEA